MTDIRTEYARLAESRLRRFRAEFSVHYAPVDCFHLVRELAASGKISLEYETTRLLTGGMDASATYLIPIQTYLIISREPPWDWKKTSASRRCNFTMAHELGHIFCGHLRTPAEMKAPGTIRMEDLEADAFAASLLMPAEIIGHFSSVTEAADALWVSESAVRRRLAETGVRYSRRVCPQCGAEGIPPAARYCRKCGLKLQPDPNREEKPEIAWLPPSLKTCVVCGSKKPALAGGICPYCEMPRRNHCLPEYDQPQHIVPADALYCPACGAETIYREYLR